LRIFFEKTAGAILLKMQTDVQAEKNTMIEHMKTEQGFAGFQACLKGLYCDENIQFWKQIENLHGIPDADRSKLEAQVKLIVDEFLDEEAPQYVNVYHPSKNNCMRIYESKNLTNAMFDVLQEDVIAQMYPFWITHYKDSAAYKDLLGVVAERAVSESSESASDPGNFQLRCFGLKI
jgi:hypothetical protein